jgi:hypothetical protein
MNLENALKSLEKLSNDDIDKIFNEINSIDLEAVDLESIINIIDKFGDLILLGHEIPIDEVIYRGVVFPNSEAPSNIGRISYNPKKSIGRCSFNSQIVFYGSIVIPDLDKGQLINFFEISDIIDYNGKILRKEYMVIGKWRVKRPLSVVTISFNREYDENSSYIADLSRNFHHQVNYFKDSGEKLLKILNFFGQIFSEDFSANEFNKYKISSAISSKVFSLGVDGILYPSVKMKGNGLNIALNHLAVDTGKIQLEYCIFQVVRSKNKQYIFQYLLESNIFIEGNVKWREIPQSLKTNNVQLKHFGLYD